MKKFTKTRQTALPAPLILALTLAMGILLFHLAYAWAGYSHYRDQHLGTALVYAREGVDLLRPIIIGFNANNVPTPQEFPIWQAAASLPLRWFSEWFGWANIVSLLIFSSSLYPAWQLGTKLGGAVVGWWTIALMLMQPLIWIYAGAGATDGTCLTASIWFFFCGCQLLESRKRLVWGVATAATGALAATLKLPFMMAVGIALSIIAIVKHRHDFGAWIALGASAAFAALAFIIWTRYTDSCIAQAEFGFVDLRVAHNPDMLWWYFGDWSYRLNPANWVKGGWRALNGLFGSFALVAVPLAVLGLRRANLAASALFIGALVVTFIFSHLVLHHHQYFLMYSLPVSLLMAPVVSRSWSAIERLWRFPKLTLMGALVAFALLCVIQGLIGLEAIQTDPYPERIAKLIREHTSKRDKLLIVEGGWGGKMLFLSDRNGLSIWNAGLLEKDNNFQRLKDLGYSKLVLISDSPLATALQVTNPGSADYQRKTYESALTDESRGWHTIYQDENLLIKDLPR